MAKNPKYKVQAILLQVQLVPTETAETLLLVKQLEYLDNQLPMNCLLLCSGVL